MHIKFLMKSVLAAFMAVALAASHAQAQTQPAPEGGKPAKSKSKKAAKSGSAASGGKAKFIAGSGETAAQRTARLKRECKGAVDAGACSGYTR
jgi:hypothetical protein